jgi:hypothetical protein
MRETTRGGLAEFVAGFGGRIGRPSPLAISAIVVFVGLIAAACGGGGGGFEDARLQTPPDLGGQHLNPGQSFDQYNSIPPTSGPHDPNLLRCAIYAEPQSLERSLHSMEHGAVLMVYHPDLLPAGPVAELQAIANDLLDGGKRIVMAPSRRLQGPLSIASWGNLLNLNVVEDDTIRGFVAAFEDEGPESFPRANAC